jgi:hypothetical protein
VRLCLFTSLRKTTQQTVINFIRPVGKTKSENGANTDLWIYQRWGMEYLGGSRISTKKRCGVKIKYFIYFEIFTFATVSSYITL